MAKIEMPSEMLKDKPLLDFLSKREMTCDSVFFWYFPREVCMPKKNPEIIQMQYQLSDGRYVLSRSLPPPRTGQSSTYMNVEEPHK